MSWEIKTLPTRHIEQLMLHLQQIECNMIIKLHFLFIHLDRLPKNLGGLSGEQVERLNQVNRIMEGRCHGLITDYYRSIQGSTPESHSLKTGKCFVNIPSFISKKLKLLLENVLQI